MSRDHSKRLEDIAAACEKILRYTSGMDQAAFIEQEIVVDAVLRNIEVIGEAAKNLPEEIRDRIPGIEWKKIAGMRDWIAHVYFKVDDNVVWNVIESKVPELLRAIQADRAGRAT